MIQRFFASLRVRLLVLVLLAVVPVMALTLYSALEQQQREIAEAREAALHMARHFSVGQEQIFQATRQLLAALANVRRVRGRDREACSAVLKSVLGDYTLYLNLAVVDLRGDVICSAVRMNGPVNVADRPYFQRALETGDFVIGQYQIGRITGKATLNLAYPLKDRPGHVQGLLFAALDLVRLSQLEFQPRSELAPGSTFTLMDPQGFVLARYPDADRWIGKLAPEKALLRALREAGEGALRAPGPDGKPWILGFARTGTGTRDGEAYAIVSIPEEMALAHIKRVLARNLTGLGIAALLAIVAAWAGGDAFVLHRVRALVGATKRLAAGDLDARTGPPYGTGELDQLAAAFDEMAGALQRRQIEHTRAAEALEQRSREIEAVRAVTAEITQELDLANLLQLLIRRAAELTGAGTGVVWLWDEVEQCLIPKAWHGASGWLQGQRFRLGEGVTGTVAARRAGLLVTDYATSPYAHPAALERRITAVLGEPLLYRDRLVGVIVLDDEGTGRAFREEDRETLALFATQAAIAIENARLFESSQQRAAELGALQQIDHAISARLDLPAVLEAVVAGGMELLGAQHVQLTLWDESTQTLSFGAARGAHAERVRMQRFEPGKGANATVALTHEPLIVNEYQASPYALPEFPDVVATITVPILFEDRLLGVLHAHSTEPGKRFTPDDLRRLQMLATQAAIAMENSQLFEEVLRAKTQWEKTFDSIPELIAIVDTEGRLVRVNRAMAEQFHVSPGDLVGRRCYTVMHGTDAPWPGCPHAQTLATGEAATLEVEDPHLGGTFLITTAPIRDEQGRLMGSVHIARDITETKRLAEEARQRQRFEDLSRAKSAFIASMSHELRTPLNAIIGFSELLRDQSKALPAERQARYLGHIHSSGKHLLQLIGDILDLSKVEAGKIVLQPQELPVAATVDDILMIVRGLANKKGQTIEARIEPDLPRIQADPVRFKQILFNLLSNAVKFTPDGGTITVRARTVMGQFGDQATRQLEHHEQSPVAQSPSRPVAEAIEIAVADTGVGIRPEDMPRLFREFSQLETTQAQKHEGTGLGLALTKRLVELHGGRIWAASEGEGRGSTFTVRLPISGPQA